MENNFKNIDQGWLSKLPKNSGHKVPEGYFDGVENDFSARLAEKHFPQKSGFEVPKGYFDSLEDVVLASIELPKKAKVIPLRKKFIQWIPTSAAAVVLVFLGVYFFKNEITSDPNSEEIAIWFENNLSTISIDELTYELEESDFEDSDILDRIVETDDITKYLDENDTYILIEDSDIFTTELN